MAKVPAPVINNQFYDQLGDRWYAAEDDPVALLRAEARLRNPWVASRLRERHGAKARLLDVGCGGGLLSNALAREGFDVVGIDASEASLAVARSHDETKRVRYDCGDAAALPYPTASFDAVTAMDFLEHVENPAVVVAEAARVLRPLGTFFFHTFNRNWLGWLVVVKGVEWFVNNTPPNMHLLRLFVKPAELRAMCTNCGLNVVGMQGSAPVVWSKAFFRMLATGTIAPDFRFEFTCSTLLAYTGLAERSA
jgi:2-polyprenyl-6-hydroxyphenyl methylase/3-demethylubiquinone-9 3-methyltransferase